MGLIPEVFLVLCLLCGSGDGTATSIPQASVSECELRAQSITQTNPQASAFCTPSAMAIDTEIAHLIAENRRLDARLAADLAAIRTPAENHARMDAYYRHVVYPVRNR